MYQASHKTDILSVLNKDRSEEESYCDVILEVEGQKFPAHKCVVGKLSRFFDKMFKVEMKEKYSPSVCLEKIKSANMKTVIDFMYIGNLQLTNENVVENLEVSDYLQIDEMKSFCVDFLVKSLDQSNCLRYHALGQTFDAQRLVDAAAKTVAKNFDEVSKEKEFNELKKEDLCLIMEAVEQKSSLIKSLYTTSITWIKHDLDNRKQHLIDLFKLIKLHLLPTSFLEEIIANESLIKDSNGCLQYFVTELLHQRNISEKNSSTSASKSSSAMNVKTRGNYWERPQHYEDERGRRRPQRFDARLPRGTSMWTEE